MQFLISIISSGDHKNPIGYTKQELLFLFSTKKTKIDIK